MINDTKNRRLYISVYEVTTSDEPDFVLVGDYQQYPEFRWTFYSAGVDSTTHPGIRIGSLFQLKNTTDGSFEVFFGNTDDNGQYYKMQDGDNDNTKGIYFKLTSRPYAVQQPLLTKLWKNTRLFAQAEDDTYSIQLCSIYDLGYEEEFCGTFTVEGSGNSWDEKNWSNNAGSTTSPLIWSGPALAELTYNPHRKSKFIQLVIKQTDADAPATLLGWGVSGSIFGGK
jgi:hypothetical protein